MKKVTIIGDGGWGTALALVLHRSGHAVYVWGPFAEYITEIKDRHENRKFLKGVQLPPDIVWTADRGEATEKADVVVLASPSHYFEDVTASFAGLIPPSSLVVSVAKGLHEATHRRMTEVAEGALGRGPIAALSGPNHAEEVARSVPTATVIACADHDIAENLQGVFTSQAFRVYTSDDVIGVELGGALKNIIAIAAGISDGIGLGDNTKAALVTRGLAEITRLGCAKGAHHATFSGLSGMGDLIVTCTSNLSRNRAVGERLGRGESVQDILDSMEQVAEGVWVCEAAKALAQEVDIQVPITEEVCAVIHEGKDPREAVRALTARDPRPERD
jgi:glycerol-3-phosphate dehydrogenase (NAD(P)+)